MQGLPLPFSDKGKWAEYDKLWREYSERINLHHDELERLRAAPPSPLAGTECPHYDPAPLMKFYDVSNIPDLIDAQDKHIERLQAKLPPTRDASPRTPRKG